MNLSQIRALVAVADHKNFSAAGHALGLSQPAVSHAIASLETLLGVTLFSRGRHGATLTPAGMRIAKQARHALWHLEQMEKEAYVHRGLKGGEVRIATFRSVATHVLPDILAQFMARFPDITVTLIEQPHYVAIEQCLKAGQADIGFTYEPGSDDSLETFEFIQDEFVALLPPGKAPPTVIEDWDFFQSYGVVLMPCMPCGVHLHAHLKVHAPDLPTRDSIQEDSTVVGMVHRGLGAAILPIWRPSRFRWGCMFGACPAPL
ncbi:MAG: LysR family transcriptional regulator, partial [Synechococcales cyanobacterium RM1_1_8]|nr:LysR family transcriptional regulator [Synechococcales cyanobacterium RM1_1_8]